MNDLIAGQVDMMFDTLTTSLPLHRAGNVKIVGARYPKGGGERITGGLATIAAGGLAWFQVAYLVWTGCAARHR